jgi:hypothetical protein
MNKKILKAYIYKVSKRFKTKVLLLQGYRFVTEII